MSVIQNHGRAVLHDFPLALIPDQNENKIMARDVDKVLQINEDPIHTCEHF